MKKLGITIVVALLLLSTNAVFATDTVDKHLKTFSTQIHKMLKKNTPDIDGQWVTAQVRFTMNREGEIVVLSVETPNIALEDFVKRRLNDQKSTLRILLREK